MSDFDAIVVGSGVAGLGQAAMLQQSGKKTLLVDRWPRPGGRLQSYPQNGWLIENGLHIVEMGKLGFCHEMAARVGVEIEWGSWTKTLEVYTDDGKWVDTNEILKRNEDAKNKFIGVLMQIGGMDEPDFAAWDNRSVDQWLDATDQHGDLREFWENVTMIMTTIPDAGSQSAGECLYIAKEAITKAGGARSPPPSRAGA